MHCFGFKFFVNLPYSCKQKCSIFQAVERRGEMIVRILELRQVGRNNIEAAKKFFQLQVIMSII